MFFLPPYAPELNPDELAWAHIKTRVAKATVQTKQEHKANVERVMHRLQKLPDIVAGFFGTLLAPMQKHEALLATGLISFM